MGLTVLDPSPSHTACTLLAARANTTAVIVEDNYIQLKNTPLSQQRPVLKPAVKRRTNTGRSSRWHTRRTHRVKTHGQTNTHVRPCIWLQPTMNSQASTFTRPDCSSRDPAVRRPKGTIICNLCPDKTDHLPSKWNSPLGRATRSWR